MLLISPAYAQDAAGPLASLGGLAQIAPIILVFGVFYFLLIRPQQTRAKQLKAELGALKRGDRVVTGGGIVGVVQLVRDTGNEVDVEIAPGVRVSVVRETINSVIKPPGPANDRKAVVAK